ncbi:trace amine-associated receptor 9-like [Stylophora pistillata]|uniref:trace amine-associated receptor 9-like n=1 Tax=Stylophora pistillata TaxID=50429 RepID=UPI000C0421C9|nr:trace amine-associated receptor 9-like [Stylophora pistillata]
MANTTSLVLLNTSITKPFGYCEKLQPFLDMNIRKKLPQFYVITSLTACIFLSILCFFALFLNAVVVFVTWRTPALHSPRNILLCSLAATDFFVGFTAQPFFVVAEMFLLFGKLDKYCLTVFMHFYSSWLFNGISFLTLTTISYERYLALRFHLRYTELITASRVIITVVIYWLIWAALVTILWFWAMSKLLAYALTAVCIILGVISLRCLALIHKTVKRHKKHVRDTNQRTFQSMIRYRRSTNTMIILVAAFALSYFPFVITTAISASQEQEDLRTSSVHCLAVAIMFANSSINPVIYFWRVTELREAAKRTLRKFHPIKAKRRTDTEFDTR